MSVPSFISSTPKFSSVSSFDDSWCSTDSGEKRRCTAGHAKQILRKLRNFCESGKGCDMKLIVEGREYLVHKVLLAVVSPYFEAMFYGNFAESAQSCVILETIESSAMKVILDFAYAGHIVITNDNVHQVLRATHLLQIPELVDRCIEFMVASIDQKCWIKILTAAKLYMDRDHKEYVKNYLLQNFREVCQEEEFLKVDAEDLIEMLKDDYLVVDNEDQVFKAVMQWILFNVEKRTPFLDKVLRHVRLAHISSNLLKERLETVDALRKSNVCQLFLAQTNVLLLKTVDASFTKPRPGWRVEAFLLCVTDNLHTREVCITESGEILKTRPIDSLDVDEILALKRYSRVVSYGKDIVAAVLGKTARIYDKYSCTWKAAFFGSPPPYDAGVVYVNGDWYFIGGFVGSGTTSRVYRFNAVSKMEQTLSSMPVSVCEAAVAFFNGMIYVFGGRNCKSYHHNHTGRDDDFQDYLDESFRLYRDDISVSGDQSSIDSHLYYDTFDIPHHRVVDELSCKVLRYDIPNDSWEELCDVPLYSEVVGACVMSERIFVFVHTESSEPNAKKCKFSTGDDRQVYTFNPTTTDWESCGDLNHKYVSGPVIFKDEMYVVTEQKPDLRSCLERYSAATDTWRVFADFPGYEVETIFGPLPIRCIPVRDQDGDFAVDETWKNLRLRLL